VISIDINLFATLRSFLPDAPKAMTVSQGTRIKDLVKTLGIPEEDVKLIFINGKREMLSYVLKDNDRVGIFPPVGGG